MVIVADWDRDLDEELFSSVLPREGEDLARSVRAESVEMEPPARGWAMVGEEMMRLSYPEGAFCRIGPSVRRGEESEAVSLEVNPFDYLERLFGELLEERPVVPSTEATSPPSAEEPPKVGVLEPQPATPVLRSLLIDLLFDPDLEEK